jgi:hypothetical protein
LIRSSGLICRPRSNNNSMLSSSSTSSLRCLSAMSRSSWPAEKPRAACGVADKRRPNSKLTFSGWTPSLAPNSCSNFVLPLPRGPASTMSFVCRLAKLVYVPFKFCQHQQPLIPLRLLAEGGQASGSRVPAARSSRHRAPGDLSAKGDIHGRAGCDRESSPRSTCAGCNRQWRHADSSCSTPSIHAVVHLV